MNVDVTRLARAVQMVSFEGLTAPPWLLDEVAIGTGSVCLFASNIEAAHQLAELVGSLRLARADVIVAIDEEGGDVTRLDQPRGSDLPGPAALGVVDDLDATAAVHRIIGRRLAALGINLDLAPCADVNVVAANPVIGVRSFGADPWLVARHVRAAVDGLQSVGVAACLKHFPGHGATGDDSHLGLPVLDVDLTTLHARELVPFASGSTAAATMTAHVVVPDVDDAPATLSKPLLRLLRDDLGYPGVIISDALDMAGVHGAGTRVGDVTPEMIGAAAVRSLVSGCDLLCLGAHQGPDVPAAVTASIIAALTDGRLSMTRLTEAADRIGKLSRFGRNLRTEPWDRRATDSDAEVAATVAGRALRATGAPLDPIRGALVVDCRPEVSMANHDVRWGLGPDLRELDRSARTLDADSDTQPGTIVAAAVGRPLVVTVRAAMAHRWQLDLLTALAVERSDLIAVELGWPSEPTRGATYPAATTITTFGASRASTRAVAALLTRRR